MRFVTAHKRLFLIFTGSLIWSLTMVKSGLIYSYGAGFWGPNGHDGIWHLSLAGSLSRGSFQMPVFAGEIIKNYHFGFDLLLALIHRLTFIPVSFLYFQIIPPLLAVGTGICVYRFVFAWLGDENSALWSVFFTYFGGSLGWLVSLVKNGQTGGESMFWAQQSISTLLNPPFALSLIIIFVILYRLTQSLEVSNKQLLVLSFLVGSLSLIKIYAAILFLLALAFVAVRKRELRKLFVLSAFFSLIFYLPFNRGGTSLVVFQPNWFLETMLIYSDRFYWPRLYEAIQAYKADLNLIKLIPAYLLTLVIFLVGNLGSRLIFVTSLRRLRTDPVFTFLISAAFAGFMLPMLFLQRGTPWNTIQFFYYTQIFLGILAGISVAAILKSNKSKYLVFSISVLVFIFTIPTTVDTLHHYLPARPPAMISREELSALDFLSRQSPGTVFTYPVYPDPYAPAPRPLYLYDSTAYVSAYSGHPVYLEDEVNLNITGYDWPARKADSLLFVNETSPENAAAFLAKNHISYIYLPLVSKYRPVLSASELDGKVIFENSRVSIWQVVR
jgi:hypothetical protein